MKANIETLSVFDQVIVQPDHYKKTKLGRVGRIVREYQFSKKRFHRSFYDELFFANFGFSSQRIFDVLKRNNFNLRTHYFEDGILSYSQKISYFYHRLSKPSFKTLTHDNALIKHYVCGELNDFWLFTPSLLEWNPDVEAIKAIDKIDQADAEFKKIINCIFDFDQLEDIYSQKYIFFEESYFQDTGYMEDVQLIDALADEVGKENLMIKIHPRNQVNRFRERGYQTNTNTVIPWEVLALNLDLDNKVLLTIASSSIVNPAAMFGCKAKAYSLMNCLANKPYQLNSDYSKTVSNFFEYFDCIKLCEDLKEVTK